jgi:signal transduction histidine kinase/ActR/RegA family two-component response regulator
MPLYIDPFGELTLPQPPPLGPSGDAERAALARQALLKTGALQNAILTSANFSLIATDETGIIQIFNVGAQRLLGYAAEEVFNRVQPSAMYDAAEVIARARALSAELGVAIAPGFEAMHYKAARGVEDIYEITYVCKDGSRVPVSVSTTALRDAQGGIIGYLLIGTDHSARRLAEDQLLLAMHTAETANHAKSEFLSRMSHELRTPLNAILGFAQLIESGTPAPTHQQQHGVGQILKAGWYLLELINEVLDLALVESGRLVLSSEPVQVLDILHECRTMMEPQATAHGIRIRFSGHDQSPWVLADHTRLKQVLINLLMNAIKYNRIGGTVAVDIVLRPDNKLRISVHDSGVGLTTAQQGQLFQPFNRLGKEGGVEEGTGIGLVVTKRLMELMHGAIGVQSEPGVGSVFWIELALATPPLLDLNEAPVMAADAPPGTVQDHYTVLYVEDNPANLDLVEQILARRSNVRLLSAANASIGIAFARSHQPDVILMDINLPGVSGTDAMRILRAGSHTAHIPIVALSANAQPSDIERGIAAGFMDYITKPLKVTTFLQSLDAALAQARQNLTITTTEATP